MGTKNKIRLLLPFAAFAFALGAASVSADSGDDTRPPKDVGTYPAPEGSSPKGSKAPVLENGLPAPQSESLPPAVPTLDSSSVVADLLPTGNSYPPATWSQTYLIISNGGKCWSKVTQYDIGNFPLFTHDLHTWSGFSGSSVSIYDEWIQQQTWNSWSLQSNVEDHYALSGTESESWANSAYAASPPSPFAFYDAWPYMRNRIGSFGQCRSENSSLTYEQFPRLQHLWWRGTYN